MKPEQRLILSLTLTLGILLLWTVLFPPSTRAPVPFGPEAGKSSAGAAAKPTALTPKSPLEPIQEITMDPFQFGLGSSTGGIQNLRVDGASLLDGAQPGLLQIEQIKPAPVRVEIHSRVEGGKLISQTTADSAMVQINRTISGSKETGPFSLDCEIQLTNSGLQTQEYQLRVALFKPFPQHDPRDTQYNHGFAWIDGKNQRLDVRPGQIRTFSGSPSWVTTQGKAHAIIIQPATPTGMFHVEHLAGNTATGWLDLPPVTLASGGQTLWRFRIYAGPMIMSRLKEAGMEDAVSLGFFSGITKAIIGILVWVVSWSHSYGFAIIFVSVAIWLIFFPITWSGIRMMKAMGKIQPQMKRIQEEHKNNPQKMNQEVMELYRKHKVNPVAGCLPLFLQTPIFLSLYQALTRSPELRGAHFLFIRDLSGPDAMARFPQPLPLIGNSLNILPIVMALAMFLQQRITASFQGQSAMTEEQKAQQQMFKFMPLMFGFLFYGLPSGLVLYWVTNTLLTLCQYLLFMRMEQS